MLEGGVEVIIIGTGQSGVLSVDSRIRGKIKSANVELAVAKTPEAVKLFNSLAQEKKSKCVNPYHLLTDRKSFLLNE